MDATWTRPDGEAGIAHAVALTPDSGYFWFLEPGNVELAVKVLDGCSTNHRYWFFSGGLTNLEVEIHVTDTSTNEVKKYANPQGKAFQPIADTAAFASCPAGAEAIGSPEEPPAGHSIAMPAAAQPAIGCATTDTVLCIDGRFTVEASWQTASGKNGAAHAVDLGSESGYFWFFDPSNVELIVKTLNACGLGKGNWFFGAGMTTVGAQVRVTDTFTGDVRTYSNPVNTAFLPIQDTQAFSFCPTPTNTPTATPTPTLTPTPTGTAAMTPTHEPRPPTATPRPSHTSVPTTSPTSTLTPTPSPTPALFVQVVIDKYGAFTPDLAVIHVGGWVEWVWATDAQNRRTTSMNCDATCTICIDPKNPHCFPSHRCVPDNIWDSGVHSAPFAFSHRFDQEGTFKYLDGAGGCVFLTHGGRVVVVP